MKTIKLGQLWEESKVVSENPNSEKRIKVKLNVQGVEKRPDKNDQKGATKYFIRKVGQFIYGKQNLHKGAFGVIPKELDNFESSSDIPAFDIIEECNPEWIYYYFKQGDFYKDLEMYSKGTGSKRIHPHKISHLEILFPDRKEQERIIEKIKSHELNHSKLDNEINYQSKLLSSLRQSILSEAVQGKLVSQNKEDESAFELLKKIKKEKEKLIKEGKIKKGKELPAISDDEIPYELPKGWVWCRLGNLVSILGDGIHGTPNYTNNGECFFVNGNNLDNGKITIKENTKRVSEEECEKYKKKLNDRTILVSINGTLGNVAFYNNEKIMLGKSACYFNLLNDINKDYIKLIIETNYFLDYCFRNATGSTIKNVSLNSMRLFPIPLPPLPEQRQIVEKVDVLMSFCDELELRVKENKVNSEGLMSGVLREAFSEGFENE
ncbi:MAG TPA: restriction endonuclease subunit S [Candidatus Nanoarchaeia archaeon]|nr:restriction endonuclease subunit S [Candidatus Nanoarchaeia archaeon]